MFRDFGRKAQRDIKRLVEARLKVTEELSQGRIKVWFSRGFYRFAVCIRAIKNCWVDFVVMVR